MPMPKYRPKFQRQLDRADSSTDEFDCGPRSWQMAIDFQTRGDRVPGIADLRRRGGVPGPQTTNVADAKRAIESFDNMRGRKPLTYYIKTLISEVKAAVKAGRAVHICINYGKWNDVMPRTGDPNFRLGHSTLIIGQRQYGNEIQWRLYDPLEDGRRAGIPGPGPRWVPRDKVIRAMEAFARANGRCYAGVIGGGQKKKR